jgi:hypothetical protein
MHFMPPLEENRNNWTTNARIHVEGDAYLYTPINIMLVALATSCAQNATKGFCAEGMMANR